MKRLRGASLLALTLAAACSDDPTGPRLAASVEILSGSDSFDERTIRVSETVKLAASPRDEAGREMSGRPVRWSSSDPAVAAVDSTGLVRGVAPGRALIVATSDTVADTARVNVALPVTGSVACDPGAPGLSLAVGESHATTGWEVGTLCFEGGAAGAEYMMVPFHASSGAGELVLDLEANGVRSVLGEPTTARLPADGAPRPDEAFHLRLRERAAAGLAGRLEELSGGGGMRPSFSRLAAVPAPGDRMRLNVETFSPDGCTRPDYRTGRVVAVTARAIVVADTANPKGGFTDEEYRAFGVAFDELVYPLAVETFGEPSDLDGNGRAIVFFTSAVNDLTTAGSGSYIGGFFYDRDLFPRSGSGACAGSNAAEMFYMMVPDPARGVDESAFSKESVRTHTVAVLAHEFQHLINASRRLHVHEAGVWEETWLNEGLSHIAEELLFYHASGLGPGGNEDGSRLTSGSANRALEEYLLQNLERHVRFLRSPQNASPINGDDLATRGAVWAFLRYAADRRGGAERELWHRLVNSRTSGIENLRRALGVDPLAWVHDWTLAVFLDDSGLPAEARHRQPSWNFRELLPRLRELTGRASPTRYPLRTLAFESDQFLGMALPGGAAGYVRVAVPAGSRAALRITSGGLPAPEKLRLTLIRTR